MVTSDKPAVMTILRQTSEFEPSEVAVAEEIIDYYLSDGITSGYFVEVAEAESAITGYVCYGRTPLTKGTWDLYWIAVAPSKKGKGFGGALMTCAESNIKSNNGRLILIETSSTRPYENTRNFYQHIGYSVVCQIRDFYKPGDHLVILEKRL